MAWDCFLNLYRYKINSETNALPKNGLHCQKWAEVACFGTKCSMLRDEMRYKSSLNSDYDDKKNGKWTK